MDVEDLASIEALAAKLKAEHGGIDGIVNNAGIAFHGDSEVPLKEQIEKTVRAAFGTTDFTAFLWSDFPSKHSLLLNRKKTVISSINR